MIKNNGFQISKETQLEYAMKCLENNPDGVYWSDADGHIFYVNNAACEELGYSKEELLEMNILEIDATVEAGDLGLGGKFVNASSSGKLTRFKTYHRHRDGHLIPVEISIGPLESQNNSLGFSFVRNITNHIQSENKLINANLILAKREEQLKDLAYHDTLTGLPNRTMLMDDLENIIRSEKEGKFALLFIDLDNFKNYNDSLGHSVGDIILLEAGKRLSNSIRPKDTIYRFGGDEFIILVRDIFLKEDVRNYVGNIKNSLIAPLKIDMMSLYLTCSIGVSVYPDHSTSPEKLLMFADTAMYRAKMNGKNHMQFFDREMKSWVINKIALQNKLRQALNKHEFFLQYQPQFDRAGRVRGIEALIRWVDAYFGDISPNVFIPVAEEMGLIILIGERVLRQACYDAKRWADLYDYNGYISVNVSANQLIKGDFVKIVKTVIEETGLDPTRLEIEITESMFIESFDLAVAKLTDLKSLGVRICLDDFGTGYSSLGYLMHLPIDTLKIDRSFIKSIGVNQNKENLTSSIVSLVSELGIQTIAEGVETIRQFEYIIKTKTDFLQGYLMSKPVSKEEMDRVLQKSSQGIPFNGMVKNDKISGCF